MLQAYNDNKDKISSDKMNSWQNIDENEENILDCLCLLGSLPPPTIWAQTIWDEIKKLNKNEMSELTDSHYCFSLLDNQFNQIF